MRNLLVGALLLTSGLVMAEDSSGDDLLELDEPYKYVTGAYWGVSVGPSFVSYKLDAHCEAAGLKQNTNLSKTMWDMALLAGFGTSFYKDYYIGIEMELMKRKGKSVYFKEDTDVWGLKFSPQFGFNMNLRLGYLFPKQGNMVYALLGFSRTLGKVVEKRNDNIVNEKGFGSYYPVVGLGVEHKINHNWNVRMDVKYSISSKDSEDRRHGKDKWHYSVRPKNVGVRFSITRNI